MELRVGGKYKVTKRLGQGAFGDIYAGMNVKTNEEVAIKLVSLTDILTTIQSLTFCQLYRNYYQQANPS